MLAKGIAPILVDTLLPPEASSREVTEFVCFHELIEAYAAAKGYTLYDSDPCTLKNCLLNTTALALCRR